MEEPVPTDQTARSPKEIEEAISRLKAKYTDKHPDVVALKKRLEEMQREGERRPETDRNAARGTRRERAERGPVFQTDTTIANVQAQLAAVDSETRHLRVEEEKVKSRIKEYEQRIETAPKIEQETINLTRDYENTKKLYESLLAKKLDSEQARAMEQRQQGQQFRILDSAQLPAKPWKPDILKMIALSLALGLGAGLGLALLVEYMDRSFKDPEDLAAFTGLGVLAVVPRIELEVGEEPKKGREKPVARVVRGMRIW
jgi:uncharacterized protein involved in exopolysaccharide biosynthesis